MHDRGDRGRIGAEMGMEVLDAELPEPPHEPRRFQPISEMPDFLPKTGTTEPSRRQERTDRPDWPRKEQDQRGRQKPRNPLRKDDFSPFGFTPVGGVLQILTGLPDRETIDIISRALDRFDLAPDEGMADRRIEVAEIS